MINRMGNKGVLFISSGCALQDVENQQLQATRKHSPRERRRNLTQVFVNKFLISGHLTGLIHRDGVF